MTLELRSRFYTELSKTLKPVQQEYLGNEINKTEVAGAYLTKNWQNPGPRRSKC